MSNVKQILNKIFEGADIRQTVLEASSKGDNLSDIETDDYQNRGGDYPDSGEPDTIQVYGTDNKSAAFSFKNTSEGTAKNWVERFLIRKGFEVKSIHSYQDGDYQDDWVVVDATVK
jgi:hypothetical protein